MRTRELHSTPLRPPTSRGTYVSTQNSSVHPIPKGTPAAVLAEVAVGVAVDRPSLPRPLFRWQLGLLLPGLPRSRIPAAPMSSPPAPCGPPG